MSDGGVPRPANRFEMNLEADARDAFAAGPPTHEQKRHERLVHNEADLVTVEGLIKIGITQLSRLDREDLKALSPLLSRHVKKANKSLRKGGDDYKVGPLVQQFSKAGMSPFEDGPVALFRGMDASGAFVVGGAGEEAIWKWLVPDAQAAKVHVHKGYWFASTSEEVAKDYATTIWEKTADWAVQDGNLHPVVFELTARWGLFIPHLRHLHTDEEQFVKTFGMTGSVVYDECQMVFPPGTRWEVVEVRSDEALGARGGHRVSMKQLDPPKELTRSFIHPEPEDPKTTWLEGTRQRLARMFRN